MFLLDVEAPTAAAAPAVDEVPVHASSLAAPVAASVSRTCASFLICWQVSALKLSKAGTIPTSGQI